MSKDLEAVDGAKALVKISLVLGALGLLYWHPLVAITLLGLGALTLRFFLKTLFGVK